LPKHPDRFNQADGRVIPVLTANRDEFDLIQQLAPAGRFIYYSA